MRKVREVLRLHYAAGMSLRAIARSLEEGVPRQRSGTDPGQDVAVREWKKIAWLGGHGWRGLQRPVPVVEIL